MKANSLISKLLAIVVYASISLWSAKGQYKPIVKLEKISAKDFQVNSPVVDNNANAVILADIGSTDFEGNTNGDLNLVFKETKRILLRSRNAFDIATVKVPVYMGGVIDEEETFGNFEATTYNLENGQITETKLDKASLFKEKYNKYYNIRKFTFPNLKEGSIIEYKFTIKSPYYEHLRNWQFQDEYPVLWSQYQVTIPPIFDYLSIRKGYLKFAIDSVANVFKAYSIIVSGDATAASDIYRFSGNATAALWVMKDIPALKLEKYTSSNKNYLAQISFNLRSIHFSDTYTKFIVKDWFKTAEDILKKPDYSCIRDNNNWLRENIQSIVPDAAPDEEKVRKIYAFLRDNFTCTDHDTYKQSQSLKKTFQTKTGNVADINILLMAMLYNQGIESDPVFLSTRDNGWANESAALINQYNYVVSRILLGNKVYVLDATQPRLGFGNMAAKCLNGFGRIINKKSPWIITLSPDSVMENRNTAVFLNNDSIQGVVGTYSSNLGYYESLELRDELAKEKQEDYAKDLFKAYPQEIEASGLTIDSLKSYDDPIGINYNLKLKFGEEDIVYFNPLFDEQLKKNPFESAERLYPVEMPYVKKSTYTLNMEVPKGYKVDELPKSTRVKLNEDEGMFEYMIEKSDDNIQMRCKVALKKATYNPDDYATLRDFFAFIVKKEAEQIVFKKIK